MRFKKLIIAFVLSLSLLFGTNLSVYAEPYSNAVRSDEVNQTIQDLHNHAEAVADALDRFISNPDSLNRDEKKYVLAYAGYSGNNGSIYEAINRRISIQKINSAINNVSLKIKFNEYVADGVSLLNKIKSSLSASNSHDNNSLRPSQGATAINGQLSTADSLFTYSDLLASIIFSKNKGQKTVDEISLSQTDIERYAFKDNNVDSHRYGTMPSYSSKATATTNGRQTYNLVKALYEFNYLVTIPNDTDLFSAVGGALNWVASAAGNLINPVWWITQILTFFSLLATLIFDVATGIMKIFIGAVEFINLPVLLGLTSHDGSGLTGWLANALRELAGRIGLSTETVSAFQQITIVVLAITFALGTIIALGGGAIRKIRRLIVNTFVRIAVVALVLPMSALTSMVSIELVKGLTESFTLANNFNTMYVVDTLKWAATMNLSLSPIYPGEATSEEDGYVRYMPNTDNITKLSTIVESKAKAAGFDDASKLSASSLLLAFAGQQKASVDDYFAMISTNPTKSDGIIAASFVPTAGSAVNYVEPDGKSSSISTGYPNSVVFLSTKSEKPDGKSESSDGIYQVGGTLNQSIDLKSSSIMTVQPALWYNPISYIYGASPASSATSELSSFSNFINASQTHQHYDPNTGKVPTDEALKNAMIVNSNALGIMNRYGGIATFGGQLKSFSTQTTAFLLQTVYSNGMLNLKGLNTISNDTGKAKNTGANGTTFVRYVMPSISGADHLSKIVTMFSVWVSAAFTAVLSLLALMRGPILGSLWMMFKTLFSALLTGDITAALKFMAYDAALKFSIAFSALGQWVIVVLNNSINSAISEGVSAANANATVDSLKATIVASNATGFVSSLAKVGVTLLILFAVSYPLASINLGARGSAPRHASFIEMICLVPFIIAESIDEFLDSMYSRIYGRSRSRSLTSKLKNQFNTRDAADKNGVTLANRRQNHKDGLKNTLTQLPGQEKLKDLRESVDDHKQSIQSKLSNRFKHASNVASDVAKGVGSAVIGTDSLIVASAAKLAGKAVQAAKVPGFEKDGALNQLSEKLTEFGKKSLTSAPTHLGNALKAYDKENIKELDEQHLKDFNDVKEMREYEKANSQLLKDIALDASLPAETAAQLRLLISQGFISIVREYMLQGDDKKPFDEFVIDRERQAKENQLKNQNNAKGQSQEPNEKETSQTNVSQIETSRPDMLEEKISKDDDKSYDGKQIEIKQENVKEIEKQTAIKQEIVKGVERQPEAKQVVVREVERQPIQSFDPQPLQQVLNSQDGSQRDVQQRSQEQEKQAIQKLDESTLTNAAAQFVETFEKVSKRLANGLAHVHETAETKEMMNAFAPVVRETISHAMNESQQNKRFERIGRHEEEFKDSDKFRALAMKASEEMQNQSYLHIEGSKLAVEISNQMQDQKEITRRLESLQQLLQSSPPERQKVVQEQITKVELEKDIKDTMINSLEAKMSEVNRQLVEAPDKAISRLEELTKIARTKDINEQNSSLSGINALLGDIIKGTQNSTRITNDRDNRSKGDLSKNKLNQANKNDIPQKERGVSAAERRRMELDAKDRHEEMIALLEDLRDK